MLGKLMKYEFKATGRVFLPLFGALLAVAVVNRIFWMLDLSLPKIIGTTISVAMIAAICVIALVLTLQRFYRNLLKNEGYLMFTLPVSTDGLIWSKLFVASIWTVASFIVVLLAITIMATPGVTFREIFDAIAQFFSSIQDGFDTVLLTVEVLILLIATLFSGILLLYTCMALSLLVNKRRVGFAFLMYFVITTIIQIIFGILTLVIPFENIWTTFTLLPGYRAIQSVFGLYFLSVAVPGAIFYVVTRYMLKNKLNLE